MGDSWAIKSSVKRSNDLPVSPRGVNVTKTTKGGGNSFVLNVPATRSHTGKRIRRYFPTEKEALKEQARVVKMGESYGKKAATLPLHVFTDASTARTLLNEAGSNVSLTDAVRAFLRITKERTDSTTMAQALEKWKEAPKAGGQERRPDSQAEINTIAKQLYAAFGGKIVAEVTADKVASFLETLGKAGADGSLSPRAFNKRIRLVSAFFAFCSRNGWCDQNIISRLKARRKRVGEKESKQPGILSADQFANLLEQASTIDASLVDYIAVCGLAGVRPEEAARLTFEQFKPTEEADGVIIIPAGKSKTRKDRHVPIRPALKLWLSREGGFYERAGKNAAEPLVRFKGQSLDKQLARVRYLAGWRVKIRGKDYPFKPENPSFPPDSLRHTFASAFLAEGGDTAALVWSFGHAGTLDTLRRHYVHRYTKSQAVSWFSVIPKGTVLPPALRIVERGGSKTLQIKTRRHRAGGRG